MQKNLAIFLCLGASIAFAGEPQVMTTTQTETLEPVPIDYIDIESAYIFESDLNHGGSFGKQDELQNEIEYGHRFQLSGNWYLRLGLSYSRFDFGNTDAPIPVHLQSGAAVIGIDYMHGADVGAFIQIRPGFYTEEHLGIRSFDCPITIARFWTIQDNKFYILTGATGSFLRAGFPVIPLVGFVWRPCDQWRVMAIPPEPRIIYSPTKNLELYVGGEITGGSFRTDQHPDFQFEGPKVAKLSGAALDFADYRAGAGMVYSVTDKIDVDLGAGYSIQRQFSFGRAGETYRTDPSPYVRLEVKARF